MTAAQTLFRVVYNVRHHCSCCDLLINDTWMFKSVCFLSLVKTGCLWRLVFGLSLSVKPLTKHSSLFFPHWNAAQHLRTCTTRPVVYLLSPSFSRLNVWFSWSVGLTVQPPADDGQQSDGTVLRWPPSLTSLYKPKSPHLSDLYSHKQFVIFWKCLINTV